MILTILAIILVISITKTSREIRKYNKRMQEREEERHAMLLHLMDRYVSQNARHCIRENEVTE